MCWLENAIQEFGQSIHSGKAMLYAHLRQIARIKNV